ncbi:hypothetical protein AJ80_00700 [Polytolypa hystricis UAMH7299]|uniref:Thioredoxin n=1 Tax=Polytolypa hystricis (strain UAMH7299) TaxID=1447883 RepID=A0A2B7Z249_POLH7|nr:hypothetical protein AJ80_00700 [Polytolypa hystricis UAMH7299]
MEVVLYVYDISKGLARNLSLAITGTQIDAIYHTSVVFGDVEYYFGRGIQQAVPGTTHHGEPLEKLPLGTSELPIEVVIEYMQSLQSVYTEDSYDLFLRNCNNFTHDLAMFLVGKGIPEHIRNLPETFLNTPFGQMMKPYIDNMLRGATQGPNVAPLPSTQGLTTGPPQQSKPSAPRGRVHNVTTLHGVEDLLASARSSCAVIFFTSSTCPPCKMVYPAYDELAAEAGDKAVLIKVDLNHAFDVSSKYNVRATPTFMTFLKGQKENEWSGASEGQLRGNVRLLIQMAWPPHPHSKLRLSSLQRPVSSYISYKKIPPLDKLVQKIGADAKAPALQALVGFIKSRETAGVAETHVPDLSSLADFIQTKFSSLPADVHFAVIDLVRVAFIDPRVSGFFAEERDHKTLMTLLSRTHDLANCPYNQQLVMMQLTCNLFTSTLYAEHLISHDALRETCIKFATHSLHDSAHPSLRTAASSFIYNLTAYNHNHRLSGQQQQQQSQQVDTDKLFESDQVELVASLLEAIRLETENMDSLHGLLLCLGLLVHLAPVDGEVMDLCRAMEAADIVGEKGEIKALAKEPLIKEIGVELLGKGLV